MESTLARYKIKPEMKSRVQEWVAYFERNRAEINDLLRDEGVWVEAAFHDSGPQGDFIYYYMKAESTQKAIEVFRASKSPHDDYHRKFLMEVLEQGSKLELLIDMDRIQK